MKINIIATFSLLLLLFSACEQVIDIKLPPHEPSLVVYSNINDGDTALLVWVGYTVGILDTTDLGGWNWFDKDSLMFSASAWVPNASVRIFENDLLLAELHPNSNLRVYQAQLTAALQGSGKTYDLEVSAPGYPTATASLHFPREAQIDNLIYEPLAALDENGSQLDRISFNLSDPGGIGDSYDFSITQGFFDTYEGIWYEYPGYLMSNDPLLEDANPSLMFTDANTDGQSYPIQVLCYPIDTFSGGYANLIVSSISRTEYFYNKSFNEYNNAVGNPFAEPVVLYTNIENGRGLFIGRQTKIFNIVN